MIVGGLYPPPTNYPYPEYYPIRLIMIENSSFYSCPITLHPLSLDNLCAKLLLIFSSLCNFPPKKLVILQKYEYYWIYLYIFYLLSPISYHFPLIRLANHSSFAFALAWVLVVIIYHPCQVIVVTAQTALWIAYLRQRIGEQQCQQTTFNILHLTGVPDTKNKFPKAWARKNEHL